MSSTISAAGSDFISGILNELQDLGRRIEEEAKSRRAVEKRADEFEASMKKLSEALGGEIRQVQQHAEALDAKAAQRAEVQAARITKIETQLPLLSMAVDLERLGSRVQAMSEEATRDRTATKAALEANAAKVDADFVEVRARLDELHVEALQLQAEVNKKAWGADVISLGSKVDNLQAEMQTRALATDVQAVEYRTTTAEKSLQMLKEEVAKKALPSDIKAVADTVGDLAAQVAANRTKAMADAEKQCCPRSACMALHLTPSVVAVPRRWCGSTHQAQSCGSRPCAEFHCAELARQQCQGLFAAVSAGAAAYALLAAQRRVRRTSLPSIAKRQRSSRCAQHGDAEEVEQKRGRLQKMRRGLGRFIDQAQQLFRGSLIARLEADCEELDQKLAEKEASLAVTKEELKVEGDRNKAFVQELVDTRRRVDEGRRLLELTEQQAQSERETLQAELKREQEEKGQLLERTKALQKAYEEVSDELEGVQNSTTELLEEAKKKVEAAEEEAKVAVKERIAFQQQLDSVKDAAKMLGIDNDRLKADLAEAQASFRGLERAVEAAKQKFLSQLNARS